jgi:hypothetical protein
VEVVYSGFMVRGNICMDYSIDLICSVTGLWLRL